MRWPVYPSALMLTLAVGAAALCSLLLGAMPLSAGDSLYAVVDHVAGSQLSALNTYERVVVVDLRLPRLILALMVGAMLAQCGAVMQGLFRNPLADPGIMGVSSGAAVGAIVAIVWLAPLFGPFSIAIMAFLGGLGATLLVYRLAHSPQGTSVLILLLAGVAVAAFAGAAIGFISYFSNDQELRQLSLWQMGSLAGAGETNLWLPLATLVGLSLYFQSQATALNALLLGECEARHMGIDVERLKRRLILCTAIGVGISVAYTGIIGFVGLVVPHLVRLTVGPNHRHLLGLSALLGGLLLCLSDLLARTLMQPAELPVGLVTALLGAPFFLVLLLQQKRRWS